MDKFAVQGQAVEEDGTEAHIWVHLPTKYTHLFPPYIVLGSRDQALAFLKNSVLTLWAKLFNL